MKWIVVVAVFTTAASAESLDGLRLFYTPSERVDLERQLLAAAPSADLISSADKRGWVGTQARRTEITGESIGAGPERKLVIGRSR